MRPTGNKLRENILRSFRERMEGANDVRCLSALINERAESENSTDCAGRPFAGSKTPRKPDAQVLKLRNE